MAHDMYLTYEEYIGLGGTVDVASAGMRLQKTH